jgi:hypothetical protein
MNLEAFDALARGLTKLRGRLDKLARECYSTAPVILKGRICGAAASVDAMRVDLLAQLKVAAAEANALAAVRRAAGQKAAATKAARATEPESQEG